MKHPLVLLACMLLAAFAALHSPAQTAAGGGNPFLDQKTNTIDDLHGAITKSPYTFLSGVYKLSIKFNSNGTGEQKNWNFKWHAKDAQTIEVTQLYPSGEPNGKKTIYTFSNDYSSFTGTDFDGITKISGNRVQ
jgi:hypothetical protein